MTEFSISGYEILAGTRILIPVDIASIQPGIAIPVTGTVNVGSIVAVIDVATINAVVDVATINSVESLGTIENSPLVTVQGAVSASLTSPVTVAGGTVEALPAQYAFTSVSATIKGSPGVLYNIAAAGESGLVAGAGTLLVLDSTSTIVVVPVAAGGVQSVPFYPGVGFGTLIGSIIGNVDATFVYR